MSKKQCSICSAIDSDINPIFSKKGLFICRDCQNKYGASIDDLIGRLDTDGENVIPCQVNSVVESPFETIAYLRPAGGTELLCWKAEQAVVQKAAQQNHMYLYIAPEQVLPLEGNKTKGD